MSTLIRTHVDISCLNAAFKARYRGQPSAYKNPVKPDNGSYWQSSRFTATRITKGKIKIEYMYHEQSIYGARRVVLHCTETVTGYRIDKVTCPNGSVMRMRFHHADLVGFVILKLDKVLDFAVVIE